MEYKLNSKWKIIAYSILTILFSLLAAVYYYQIQVRIKTDVESLYTVFNIHYGIITQSLWFKIATPFVKKFGLTHTSWRMLVSFLFFFISLFTLDLSVRKRNVVKIYLIPLYMLFMFSMHLGVSGYYRHDNEQAMQYGFNQHMLVTLFSIVLLWILYQKFSEKIIIRCCVIIAGILAYLNSDLIIVLTFILPILTVFMIQFYKEDKKGRVRNISIAAIFMIISVLKVLSYKQPSLINLFMDQADRYSGNVVYGSANFIGLDNLCHNILNYICICSGLFNVELAEKSTQNLALLGYGYKIVFIVIGYIFIIRGIVKVLKAKNDELRNSEVFAEGVLSLGFVLLSIIFIITHNGDDYNCRYLSVLLPYLTIIICRNIDHIMEKLKDNHLEIKKSVFILITLSSTIMLLDLSYFTETRQDDWELSYEIIENTIEEYDLHDGLACYWIGNIITVDTIGKNVVMAASMNDGTMAFEEYLPIDREMYYDFVVLSDRPFMGWLNCDLDKLVNSYGTPTAIVEAPMCTIVIYKDGRLMIPMERFQSGE